MNQSDTSLLTSRDQSRPIRGQSYLGLDDLRGEVLRGPAQGPRPVADPLGEAEVCYLQVSVPEDIDND